MGANSFDIPRGYYFDAIASAHFGWAFTMMAFGSLEEKLAGRNRLAACWHEA